MAALILPTLAVKGQAEEPVFPLEGVEIISDRLGHAEARTGRHITVVRSEDILRLPVHSLDELLRYVPFLETHARGGFGVQSDILMRGATFNQVLVLLDGIRINDPLTGHFNSYIPVPLTEISRIEVYRGPASSLYGPDAVGGVINIITKSFLPGEGKDGTEGQLEAWYGQHKLVRSNSGIHISRGRLTMGAGVSFNRSDGHPLSPDTLRGDFRLGTISVSSSFKITENIQAGIRTAYDDRLFNARYFYTSSPLDLSREQVERWWNQMFLRFRLNASNTMTLQAGYQATADSFLFNPDLPANTHQTHYRNYQVNHQYISMAGQRLATGLQADRKSITSSDRGNHDTWHTGAYFMLSSDFFSSGTLAGGLRLDYDQAYGLEVLPQINLAWTVNNWNLRSSIGRSIRSPDFTEQYISTGLEGPLSQGRNLGNPSLVAERSWSFEAGFDRAVLPDVQFRVTGFYRFSRDLIDFVMTEYDDIENNGNLLSGESYFWALNMGLLDTWGVEGQMEGVHVLKEGLFLDWGLSCQAISGNNDATVSKYLSAHARNLVNARMGLRSRSFRLQLTSLYKRRDAEVAEVINESLTSSYSLFNLRTDVFFFDQTFMLSLQVNNIFNRSYSDVMGALMPGRWIAGGLTWSFTDK